MSETLSFLEEDDTPAALEASAETQTQEPQPEPQPEPEPAPSPAPAPQPEPEPAPQPAPAAEPERRESPYVPLAAHLDERDKRQRAEAELERLRAAQPQPRQEPVQRPDPTEDPDGYEAYIFEQVDRRNLVHALNISQANATRAHGAELVQEGLAWFRAQPPAVQEEIRRSPDPYEYAVQQAKLAKAYSQIQDPAEIERYLAWKAAQEQAAAAPQAMAPASTAAPAQPAPAAPPQPAPSPTPPRSLASAPSAGGVQTQVPAGDPFEEEFKRKR